VEVVIALLVLVVGLLGILTLFPLGLDSSRDAGDDTHSAQFASRVFNGILGQAVASTSLWNQIYATATNNCTNELQVSLAPMSGGLWSSETGLVVNICDRIYNNNFVVADDGRIVEHTYRYKLMAYVTEVMRWDNRFAGQGRATWEESEGTNNATPPQWVTNWVTYWWVCPIQYNNNQLHYRRKILRLVLEVYPEHYGDRNKRTFYCYLPKLM
jgi:Tfp pilus assembly protein PilV